MNQRVTIWLLVMLNSTFLSARFVRVGTKKCSNSKQCLSQEGKQALPCCSLEYVSQNIRTSCSNLTIFIDCNVLKLKGIAKFEHCHNLSIIGRNRTMPSTIDCKESSEKMTYPRNKELEGIKYTRNDSESWKQNWSSYKFTILKHRYKNSALLSSSSLSSRGLICSVIFMD